MNELYRGENGKPSSGRTITKEERGNKPYRLDLMLPDTIPLTDEQFKTFLEKAVVNDYGRRMLASITAQNAATATPDNGPPGQSRQYSASKRRGAGAGRGSGARVKGLCPYPS